VVRARNGYVSTPFATTLMCSVDPVVTATRSMPGNDSSARTCSSVDGGRFWSPSRRLSLKRRSASAIGIFGYNIESTIANVAVESPMPTASESVATAANTGERRSCRIVRPIVVIIIIDDANRSGRMR
jgi:hypothetical protein